jgi:hypothetical protein
MGLYILYRREGMRLFATFRLSACSTNLAKGKVYLSMHIGSTPSSSGIPDVFKTSDSN